MNLVFIILPFIGSLVYDIVLAKKKREINTRYLFACIKHVILCERSPFEAVQNNIMGVQNIILAAHENHAERVIFTSSDKAVNPTNVMGTSKLMGERLMTAADNKQNNGKNRFCFHPVFGFKPALPPNIY